jgi:hypothetical protein
MDLASQIARLAADAQAITALVEATTDAQARWRPGPEDWSILEVICHLADEEREDFRMRLDYTLHRPGAPWPPTDPQGWVTERGYNEHDLASALADFRAERARSIAWLESLAVPDWDSSYSTRFGPLCAGDLLASWVAHDLLHLRQLVELHWAWTNRAVAPYETRYAGEW